MLGVLSEREPRKLQQAESAPVRSCGFFMPIAFYVFENCFVSMPECCWGQANTIPEREIGLAVLLQLRVPGTFVDNRKQQGECHYDNSNSRSIFP